MYSRIFRNYGFFKLLPKASIIFGASLVYYNRTNNWNQDVFNYLHKQTQEQIVKFRQNGKIVGQGAILKNGLIIANPDLFQEPTHIQAFINGKQYNYKIVKIEDGIAILSLTDYKQAFSLQSNYIIGQEIYLMGVDSEGNNEFQQCPIQDSNYSMDIQLVGEETLNVPYPFFQLHNCASLPGSPVVNKKGELLGITLNSMRNKTKILPTKYFEGLETNLNKPYFGCTLKTSEEGGAFIIKINSDSPADRAGLRLGEIIKSIDGIKIQHGKDVSKIFGVVNRKQSYQLEISRDGRIRNVTVIM